VQAGPTAGAAADMVAAGEQRSSGKAEYSDSGSSSGGDGKAEESKGG
jgi:hypothetical protein